MTEENVDPLRFGILGCAKIARKVSRAILKSPNSTLVAIGSRSLEKAKQYITENGLSSTAVTVRPLGSYEAVIEANDVDAVYIPLPTSLHVKWVVAAAERGKHVLLEKPTALCTADLDTMLGACRANGVQFMDATMWMHHPRTAKMQELLANESLFGQLKSIYSSFSYKVSDDFLRNDIRTNPDLDGLGILGDMGWYGIRAILWATNRELPRTAIALPGTVKNEAGVILACGASLVWDDGKVAVFQCSCLANLATELTVVGTEGTLHLNDFVIPWVENSATFTFAWGTDFSELQRGLEPLPSEHVVSTELGQEVLMVQEFSRLAKSKVDDKWPAISRETQLVLDAVKESVDKGGVPVDIST